MTRMEEKLYLQTVFEAIDEVYQLKNQRKSLTYEERLRASFSKLILPDWYNHDYTKINGLRKTKSQGQVPRSKRYENPNSNDSSHLFNGNHRHRSPSRCWSERAHLRRNSTASSYDTNGSVIINGRRSMNSNGASTYAPGVQRVAQSSSWYKPEIFTLKHTNGHSNEAPKPLPRYSKIDQERRESPSKLVTSNGILRHPIKPRTMAQVPIPPEESSIELSSDGDRIILEKPSTSSSRTIDVSSLKLSSPIPPQITVNNSINPSMTSTIPRIDSSKSLSSEAESYHSLIQKNLLATDSSSYTSVNDQCLSTASSSSYHTAVAGDISSSSSVTGYETPIPQLEDETLSSHSSISDLSHAETLEPNAEDLDIVTVSTEEQKTAIIPPVDVGMENLPLPPFSSTLPTTSSSSSTTTTDNSPSTDSRPTESTNWYDDGSIATCIDQTSPQIVREISDDKLFHEVDMNAVNDEFFLISPPNTIDDEFVSSNSDEKLDSPTQISKRLYTTENEDFHSSSTMDPFGSNHNNNNSSIMITNLDDILMDDDDDDDDDTQQLKDPSNYFLNPNYRRPIQEDILYEVEHENSYSDHSQNTSSILIADDNVPIKIDPNLEFLTSKADPISDDTRQTLLSPEKKSESTNDRQTLPIYILPPLYRTMEDSSALRVDTNTSPSSYKWDSTLPHYSTLSTSSSPSSYTSKIRHRHFSVGSYYDNKTTTVALHPNHTLYIIGSAPVSPISRTSTTSSESHYMHLHSPVSYGNVTLNALRRVNPFLETNAFVSTYEYPRSSSLNRDDLYRTISPPSIPPQPLPQINTVISSEQQITTTPPKTISRSPPPLEREKPIIPSKTAATSPPPLEREPPIVRPKTSRGLPQTPSPPPPPPPPIPPRTASTETESTQNIYQEIDSASTDDDQVSTTRSADLQFIRGTIERVFDFHDESTSEASTNYDQISEDNKNNHDSTSLSNSSKTVSKKNDQYPAVEAVQRFYETKSPSESEKMISRQPTTNLDDLPASHHSSTSNKLYARSHPANIRPKDLSESLSKSSDNEQASSEEVDDTLNDIEDDDYQDDKFKRQPTNRSSHTSSENSPLHSSDNQTNVKKTSQETQTLQRQQPIILTTQSPSGSHSTVQSYETAHSSAPPLDIVTQMIIERNDSIDDGRITEITGDMIIFYDDIEIVEHSSELSSSESESRSSISKSLPNSRPVQTIVESHGAPPPIPARTLKPLHLRNNQSPPTPRTQPQPPPPPPPPPPPASSSQVNRTYELEKSTVRRKFDVNSVNGMLNRTDYNIGAAVSHRHPSARHFVGKLNSEDSSSRNSSVTSQNILLKPSTTTIKSQTLPTQPVATNGHSNNPIPQSPTKNPYSTLPKRSPSAVNTNGRHLSPIADTNALVKQIQNSLSRNSLHDSQVSAQLSVSTKDLRTFVSSTYSPSDENMMDDNGVIHLRQGPSPKDDEQAFKRQARLSKSFHNVSEYSSTDQYPKKEKSFPARTQPSKSVENNLNRVSQNPIRHAQIPINFPPIIASTSFSALSYPDDTARLLSMKWYTGQVSENSEISYNTPHADNDDHLYAYISAYSNREIQLILARLQASNDIRIHAALDDMRLRVAQFDASKTPDELPVFMRYLESRLRDINSKNPMSSATASTTSNGHRRQSSSGTNNGNLSRQQSDTISIKSRTSSIATGLGKETPPLRQLGRQHLRSTGNIAGGGGGGTNGHPPPPPLPRRGSQSSSNQENPVILDDMLNTVLGLPKKGASTLPQSHPTSSSQSREKLTTPLNQTQMTTSPNNTRRDAGKRLFESGTYKDPRLIYDGPRKNEKEERPLETSV